MQPMSISMREHDRKSRCWGGRGASRHDEMVRNDTGLCVYVTFKDIFNTENQLIGESWWKWRQLE